MKTLTLTAYFLGITCPMLPAFDPIGPPPSSSIAGTVAHVTLLQLSEIDYPDGPLVEVLNFIRMRDIPAGFGVVIDASRMNLPPDTRVKLVAKGISILEAASIVAEQIKADLLIQPGKILLIPKSEPSTGSGSDKSPN